MKDGKPDSTPGDRGGPGYTRTLGNMLNKRFGIPKGKHSIKVPKYRIARPEDLSLEQLNLINDGLKKGELYLILVDEGSDPPKNPATLPSKQQDIISDLTRTRKDLNEYIGLNFHRLGEEEIRYIQRLREDYINLISEAVRAGLIWHPLVHEFVYTHRAFGDKQILRRIKRGWEKGTKRPIKEKDIKFYFYREKIEKYRSKGKTWLQIRRDLMKRKIISNISLQALQKKIAKFAPHLLRDTEFRITEDMRHLITEDITNKMIGLWREFYARGRKSQYRQEVKKLFKNQGLISS